jgi:uncharacterized membrane protein
MWVGGQYRSFEKWLSTSRWRWAIIVLLGLAGCLMCALRTLTLAMVPATRSPIAYLVVLASFSLTVFVTVQLARGRGRSAVAAFVLDCVFALVAGSFDAWMLQQATPLLSHFVAGFVLRSEPVALREEQFWFSTVQRGVDREYTDMKWYAFRRPVPI